jgi:hypothetical protein
MIVWGGTNQTNYLNSGGRYNPATDTWTPVNLANIPNGRIAHNAVWTGSEMIVWGRRARWDILGHQYWRSLQPGDR